MNGYSSGGSLPPSWALKPNAVYNGVDYNKAHSGYAQLYDGGQYQSFVNLSSINSFISKLEAGQVTIPMEHKISEESINKVSKKLMTIVVIIIVGIGLIVWGAKK